jgi:glycosyltransferase involved in cell wall biosynthesis
MTRTTILSANKVTAVSRGIMRHPLLRIRGAEIIQNGIDEADFDDATDHATPQVPVRLITLSRLSKHKGIDTAVEAVAMLVRDGVEVRYDIYGGDADEQVNLEALIDRLGIRNCVALRGRLKPADRARAFAEADLCIVPSRRESFGLVALEAMAVGLPVVATNVEGLPEVTGDAAILTNPDDADALRTGILSALDPAVRRSMIARGRQRARSFLWDRVVEEYEASFDEVIASAPRRLP